VQGSVSFGCRVLMWFSLSGVVVRAELRCSQCDQWPYRYGCRSFLRAQSMTKGEPWTHAEEKQLAALVSQRKSVDSIVKALGKSEVAVNSEMRASGLRLKDNNSSVNQLLSSSKTSVLKSFRLCYRSLYQKVLDNAQANLLL